MASGNLTPSEIDVICDQFEKEWKPRWTPDELVAFTGSHVRSTEGSFLDLYLEIVQVEIERRWKHHSKFVSDEYCKEPQKFSYGGSPIASWQEFVNALPKNFREKGCFATLEECELRTRCKFGDVPSLAEHGVAASDLPRYQKLMPIVSLRQGSALLLQAPFWNHLHVGRQSLGDPDPPFVLTGPRQKLICMSLEETTVSRNQLTVEILPGKLAAVCNTSGNRYFQIDNRIEVPPHIRVLTCFPFFIALDNRVLKFQRPLLE